MIYTPALQKTGEGRIMIYTPALQKTREGRIMIYTPALQKTREGVVECGLGFADAARGFTSSFNLGDKTCRIMIMSR